jgi:hypothetical protein
MPGVTRARRATLPGAPLVDEGIRKLCVALIEGCETDLRVFGRGRGWETDKPHPASERAWLASAAVRPGSFVWACQALGLEPGYVRRGMLAKVRTAGPTPQARAQRHRRRTAHQRRVRTARRAAEY